MIKKNNKILVGALALLLVMTIGYALFSDTLTINGTATAQGNFDLDYSCTLVTSENQNELEKEADYKTKGGTGACTVNGNTITTTSTLTKPTDEVIYRIIITNVGTIPAILKTADSSNNYNGRLEPGGDEIYFDADYWLRAYYEVYQIEQEIGALGDSEVENAKITIKNNETIIMYIHKSWEDAAFMQAKLPEDGVTFDYNITLGFEQITAE